MAMQEIVRDAWEKRYAVGYFECWNLESALAVVDVGMRSPVIIGLNGGFLTSEGIRGFRRTTGWLEALKNLVSRAGIEPATPGLKVRCSTY